MRSFTIQVIVLTFPYGSLRGVPVQQVGINEEASTMGAITIPDIVPYFLAILGLLLVWELYRWVNR